MKNSLSNASNQGAQMLLCVWRGQSGSDDPRNPRNQFVYGLASENAAFKNHRQREIPRRAAVRCPALERWSSAPGDLFFECDRKSDKRTMTIRKRGYTYIFDVRVNNLLRIFIVFRLSNVNSL